MPFDPSRQNPSRGRLLVIAADQEALLHAGTILGPHGYQVVTPDTWAEARTLLEQERFDLVLSDLSPGKGSGKETVSALRALGGFTELLVTVPPERLSDGREALCHGAAGYLVSPLDAAELLTLIERRLYHREEEENRARLAQEGSELRNRMAALEKCLAFLHFHDLDRLGDQILDTLMELCAAESGILWLAGIAQDDPQLRSRRGLAQIGAASPALSAATPEAAYLQQAAPACTPDQRTLYVPLRNGGAVVGLIRLDLPGERERFTPADLHSAAGAAPFAATALHALLHQQRAEHDLLRVPGSQAYNMAFFRDHLDKELLASRRYDRKLSLIKLVIDNYDELTARFHHRQVGAAIEDLLATVATVLRDADLISEIAPGLYYLLLPETDAWGALMAQRRIRKALGGQLLISDLKKNLPIQVRMRSASAPTDGTTLPVLDRLIEERLTTLRRSLLLRPPLEQAPFWTVVETLLSRLPGQPDDGGRFLTLDAAALEAFCTAVCRELLSDGEIRGVILRGCDDFAVAGSALSSLPLPGETRTALYLLGGSGGAAETPGWVTIPLHDDAFAGHAFLLCLGEDHAYALLARREQEHWQVFHTHDFYFVESMFAKLQEQYQLQTQI